MTIMNTGLIIVLILSSLFFIARAVQLKRQRVLLFEVGQELDKTLAILKKTSAKKLAAGNSGGPFEEPHMLASIITLLIHKFGPVRINVKDFESMGEDDYVSVYVDEQSKDLILALNSTKVDSSSALMVDFFNRDTDDNTYH
tara:strand:- start:98 stop:523 length:426 start_codon:yes stop_codon:yes gene_type:complete